jgi:hypothetical protein
MYDLDLHRRTGFQKHDAFCCKRLLVVYCSADHGAASHVVPLLVHRIPWGLTPSKILQVYIIGCCSLVVIDDRLVCSSASAARRSRPIDGILVAYSLSRSVHPLYSD